MLSASGSKQTSPFEVLIQSFLLSSSNMRKIRLSGRPFFVVYRVKTFLYLSYLHKPPSVANHRFFRESSKTPFTWLLLRLLLLPASYCRFPFCNVFGL